MEKLTTKSGAVIECRNFLPQRWARKQQQILLKGVKTKDTQNVSEELDSAVALEALDIMVDGMVVAVDGASDVRNRLDLLPDTDYSEIVTFVTKLREKSAPKADS